MLLDTVIVGGGIAGLATAYELSRRGASFVLFEAAARLGGVILSEQVDGFTIDAGPDSLLVQKPAGVKLCEELGLGDRLISTLPPRLAYIQRNRRLHALPAASILGIPTQVGPFVSTRLFSWSGKARMGAELFVPPRRDGADESIGAFMTRRFGREATDYLAEPLLAGIHAGDVDRLSINALFPRLRDAERTHGSLLRAFRPRPGSPPPSTDGAFRSLPGGLSELVSALVPAIGAARLRTGQPVAAITGSGPFVIRTLSDEAFEARTVVVATPAHVTGPLLRERDPEIDRLCRTIPYASVATVALAFMRRAVAHPLYGAGFVVPRVERNGILAASWLSSKWPHRAPEGHVLIRTFVGGARDPQAIQDDDFALVSRSLTALGPVLGLRANPLFTRVYRWKDANAQHEVGHLDRIAALDRALARHPGLFVTGSGFRGVGIPDCIADGRATAAAVVNWITNREHTRTTPTDHTRATASTSVSS